MSDAGQSAEATEINESEATNPTPSTDRVGETTPSSTSDPSTLDTTRVTPPGGGRGPSHPNGPAHVDGQHHGGGPQGPGSGRRPGGPQGPGGAPMGPGGAPPGPGGPEGPGGGMLDAQTGVMCIPTTDNLDSDVQYPQDALGEITTVVFSGTVTCDSCTSDLTLRAIPAPTGQTPSEEGQPVLTAINVSPNAPYRLTLPKSDTAVVLELLANDNGNWFGVKDGQGQLIPQNDRANVDLNVSQCSGTGAQ